MQYVMMDGTSLMQAFSAKPWATLPTVQFHTAVITMLFLILYACVHAGAVALQDQYLTSYAYYGIPLLTNITCDGTESTFAECSYVLSDTTYCNYDFAGVYCQGFVCVLVQVGLLFIIFLINIH